VGFLLSLGAWSLGLGLRGGLFRGCGGGGEDGFAGAGAAIDGFFELQGGFDLLEDDFEFFEGEAAGGAEVDAVFVDAPAFVGGDVEAGEAGGDALARAHAVFAVFGGAALLLLFGFLRAFEFALEEDFFTVGVVKLGGVFVALFWVSVGHGGTGTWGGTGVWDETPPLCAGSGRWSIPDETPGLAGWSVRQVRVGAFR